MFAYRKDRRRIENHLGSKPAEGCVARNERHLHFPMAAFGEAICKVRDTCRDDIMQTMTEMNRLMDEGFFNVMYISNPSAVFRIAKDLSAGRKDGRDEISPMDALILASAVCEKDCDTFYTSDIKLLRDTNVQEIVCNERMDLGYEPLNIREVVEILRPS